MRTILLAAVLALAAAACAKSSSDAPAAAARHASIPTVTIDEADQLIAQGKAQPVDCNGDATRKKLGVVPGAVLLTDEETYSFSQLPSDKAKPLVFYCANPECGASHQAAERALTAGYTQVKVMPDGIAGWVKAGKRTRQL